MYYLLKLRSAEPGNTVQTAMRESLGEVLDWEKGVNGARATCLLGGIDDVALIQATLNPMYKYQELNPNQAVVAVNVGGGEKVLR